MLPNKIKIDAEQQRAPIIFENAGQVAMVAGRVNSMNHLPYRAIGSKNICQYLLNTIVLTSKLKVTFEVEVKVNVKDKV